MEISRDYLKVRKQFGQTIENFQVSMMQMVVDASGIDGCIYDNKLLIPLSTQFLVPLN